MIPTAFYFLYLGSCAPSVQAAVVLQTVILRCGVSYTDNQHLHLVTWTERRLVCRCRCTLLCSADMGCAPSCDNHSTVSGVAAGAMVQYQGAGDTAEIEALADQATVGGEDKSKDLLVINSKVSIS